MVVGRDSGGRKDGWEATGGGALVKAVHKAAKAKLQSAPPTRHAGSLERKDGEDALSPDKGFNARRVALMSTLTAEVCSRRIATPRQPLLEPLCSCP